MPLLKKRPFSLVEPPKDLGPHELVYQIRFTKEIFRSYQEYLTQLTMYRQRVWTCKVTGKTNLTYEEALVSEHQAAEKVQEFPKEFIASVLHMVQYSMLGLLELVNTIHAKLQTDLFEGLELHGKKDGTLAPCRILRIIQSGGIIDYEVGWLGKDKNILGTSVLKAGDVLFKRPPIGRFALKVFIRESTSQNSPWVIHEELAKEYGISTEPPKELKSKLVHENGILRYIKEGKRASQEENGELQIAKRQKGTQDGVADLAKKEPIKYPIEDLLIQPASDDPILSKRPPLMTDFRVPMNSVGDLLSVWQFCSSFGRFLHLFPFSLYDFESAICHRESNAALIGEVHASFLHLLIKDKGEFYEAINSKKRKMKVTQRTWPEFLCDFLEVQNKEEYSSYISTIRRGHYSLIEVPLKLSILRDLVEEANATDALRDLIDERIEQQQLLVANKRESLRKKDEVHVLDTEENMDKVNQDKLVENGKENAHAEKEEKMISSGNKNINQHFEWELEKLSIRTSALGKDRNHNMFWFFRHEGRIFVESSDFIEWGYYSTREELDALIGSLNEKGIREKALKRQIGKFYYKISAALEKRSKEEALKQMQEEDVLRRSTRVRAQPKDNQASSFLKYVNKWKTDS